MKKNLFFRLALTVLLAVFLSVSVVSVGVFAEDGEAAYIYDYAALFDTEEWMALEERAAYISDTYGIGVYLVTLDDYRDWGDDMEAVCHDIYYDMELGIGEEQNGVLLLLSMDNRDWWLIDVGEGAAEVITDTGYESLKPAFLEPFGDDDWYGGINGYLSQCEYLFAYAEDGEAWGDSYDDDDYGYDDGYDYEYGYNGYDFYNFLERAPTAYGVAALVGLIAAIVTCSIFKAQMRTAKRATEADAYVKLPSVIFRVRGDRYTHTTTTRRKIENDNDSSSGGSNHSSGGKF